jgi:ligand-binding sensor domain-containing protein
VRFLLILLVFSLSAKAQNTMPGIGAWREHLPYQNAIDVTASANKIYAATLYSLFTVEKATGEITRMSKVSGLSETGISTIRFDEALNKLYIAYSNSNIDILDDKGIHNIPDLQRENIAGDKTIYHFYPSGGLCYLSTGIGVIVIDPQKFETKDAWFIGDSGKHVKTLMFTKDNSFFYAATVEGLKRTPVTTPNPADFQAWTLLSGQNGLAADTCKAVINFQNKIIALQNDSLFVLNGTAWQLFFTNGNPIVSANLTSDKIAICQSSFAGSSVSQVILLNNDGSVSRTLQQPGLISFPQKAIIADNNVWIADRYSGLSQITPSGSNSQYIPNSPQGIAFGEMVVKDNLLYATAGSVNDSWQYQYNREGIFKLADGNWSTINGYYFPKIDSLLDFITIAIDPRDNSAWAGSFSGGLVHIKNDNNFEIYKQNSNIRPAVGDPTSYRVSGLAFDDESNLWVANYGAMPWLHVLKNDNTWQSFIPPFNLTDNAVAQILIDDANQKWIVAPKGNGLICFNHGNSITNPSDDKWKLFQAGRGFGNLPAGEVMCIAKDRSGFIWVGTSDGIAVIECAESVFTSGCEAVIPIVKGGNFANYLFKGEEVRSIAIDGADRKWVATKNGAWLISADGDILLQHYTEENSSLLGNDIRKITINHQTGEVFFATTKGISSFRGEATEGADNNKQLLVFPNPVPAGYNGTIAIKGLAADSYIKITELNGRLVFQAKALGGQAVWNGKDYKGRQIASGIYLVLVTDENRKEKAAGKIVFISR